MQASPFEKILNRRLRVSFSVRTVLFCVIGAVLLFYLSWETYWYQKVGLACVKWHTHVMLYVFLFVLGYVFFRAVGFRFARVQKVLFSIWLGLFFMEVLLLLWGDYRTPSERGDGAYQSAYQTPASYYHTSEKEFRITRAEFEYTYPLNSLGFPDREWALTQQDTTEKRILALGDSFTHGDGEPYGGAYVFRLGKLLNGQDNIDAPYYMMNGGFCGSDPFFNYINFRDRLLPYSPNVVIQMISSQDMLEDYPIRRGMERFLPNGELKYKSAPWWEPLYAVSDIVRVLATLKGYDHWLLMEQDKKEDTMPVLIQLFEEYIRLCREHGILLYVVFRPSKGEVKDNKYEVDFSALREYLQTQQGVYVCDLLPYYKQYISSSGTNISDYHWKKDGHYNAAGYQMMAEGVYECLKFMPDSMPLHNCK